MITEAWYNPLDVLAHETLWHPKRIQYHHYEVCKQTRQTRFKYAEATNKQHNQC